MTKSENERLKADKNILESPSEDVDLEPTDVVIVLEKELDYKSKQYYTYAAAVTNMNGLLFPSNKKHMVKPKIIIKNKGKLNEKLVG